MKSNGHIVICSGKIQTLNLDLWLLNGSMANKPNNTFTIIQFQSPISDFNTKITNSEGYLIIRSNQRELIPIMPGSNSFLISLILSMVINFQHNFNPGFQSIIVVNIKIMV